MTVQHKLYFWHVLEVRFTLCGEIPLATNPSSIKSDRLHRGPSRRVDRRVDWILVTVGTRVRIVREGSKHSPDCAAQFLGNLGRTIDKTVLKKPCDLRTRPAPMWVVVHVIICTSSDLTFLADRPLAERKHRFPRHRNFLLHRLCQP